MALHWHEEMEIIAVKKGNGRITVDTVSYPVSEGDILAVFPGQLHAISCGAGERMEYENIIFRISMLMGDNGDNARCIFLVPCRKGQAKKAGSDTKGQPDYEVLGNVIRGVGQIFAKRREMDTSWQLRDSCSCFVLCLWQRDSIC